jgi:hypothetical protein
VPSEKTGILIDFWSSSSRSLSNNRIKIFSSFSLLASSAFLPETIGDVDLDFDGDPSPGVEVPLALDLPRRGGGLFDIFQFDFQSISIWIQSKK